MVPHTKLGIYEFCLDPFFYMGYIVDHRPNSYKKYDCHVLTLEKSPYPWVIACLSYNFFKCLFEISVCVVREEGLSCLAALSWAGGDSDLNLSDILHCGYYSLKWKDEMDQIVVVVNGNARVYSVEWFDTQTNCKISAFEMTLIISNALNESSQVNNILVNLDLILEKSICNNPLSFSTVFEENMLLIDTNYLYIFNLKTFAVSVINIPHSSNQSVMNIQGHNKIDFCFPRDNDLNNDSIDVIKSVDIKMASWFKSIKSLFIVFKDGSFIFGNLIENNSFRWSCRCYISVLVGYPFDSNSSDIPFIYEKYNDQYCSARITTQDLDKYLDISDVLHKKLRAKKVINGRQQEELVCVLDCVSAKSNDNESKWGGLNSLTSEMVLITRGKHFLDLDDVPTNKVGNTSHTYSLSKFKLTFDIHNNLNFECMEWINICHLSSPHESECNSSLQIIQTTNKQQFVLIYIMGKVICKSFDELSTTIFLVETNCQLPTSVCCKEVSHCYLFVRDKLIVNKNYTTGDDECETSSHYSHILLFDLFEESSCEPYVRKNCKKLFMFSHNITATKEQQPPRFLSKMKSFLEVRKGLNVIEFPMALCCNNLSSFLHSKLSVVNTLKSWLFLSSNADLLITSSASQTVYNCCQLPKSTPLVSQEQLHSIVNNKSQLLGYLVCCFKVPESISSVYSFNDNQINLWLYNCNTKRWKCINLSIADNSRAKTLYADSPNPKIQHKSLKDINHNFFILHMKWFKTHSIILFTKRNSNFYLEIISRKTTSNSQHGNEAFPRLHRLIQLPIGFYPSIFDSFTISEKFQQGRSDICRIAVSDGLNCICYQVIASFGAETTAESETFFVRNLDDLDRNDFEVKEYQVVELWNIQLDKTHLNFEQRHLNSSEPLTCFQSSKIKNFRLFFKNNPRNDQYHVNILINFYDTWGVYCIDPTSKSFCQLTEETDVELAFLSHEFHLFTNNHLDHGFTKHVQSENFMFVGIKWHPVLVYQKSILNIFDKYQLLKLRLKIKHQKYFSTLRNYSNEIRYLDHIDNKVCGYKIVGFELQCHFSEVDKGFMLTAPKFLEGGVSFRAISVCYLVYLGIFQSKLCYIDCDNHRNMCPESEFDLSIEAPFKLALSENQLLWITQFFVCNVPIYSVCLRYFIYRVESAIIRLLECDNDCANNQTYQLFSAFLFSLSSIFHSEIFTKLTRKLEPKFAKSMFPLCYLVKLHSSVDEWKWHALTLPELFENMMNNSDELGRTFLFANRMLSVACEALGGSDSHETTTACLILATQLFCSNMICLSCTNMMECLNFILRLEEINREYYLIRTRSNSRNNELTLDNYVERNVTKAICCILNNNQSILTCDKSTCSVNEDSTLWTWVWNLITPVSTTLPTFQSTPIQFVFRHRSLSDILKKYSIISLVENEYFRDNKMGLFRVLGGIEGQSFFIYSFSAYLKKWTTENGSCDLSIALIMIFCLKSTKFRKCIKSFLSKNVKIFCSENQSDSKRFLCSERVEKLAMMMRLHKYLPMAGQQNECVEQADFGEAVNELMNEQYLRRLIDLENNDDHPKVFPIHFELFGDYYGSEFNNVEPEYIPSNNKNKFISKSNVFSKWEILKSLTVGYMFMGQSSHALSVLLLCNSIFPEEIQKILVQIKNQSVCEEELEKLNRLVLNCMIPEG